MSGYKLGVVSVSFRKYTPEEIIQAVKEVGLECIEWGSDIHAPCDEPGKINYIVKLQRKYGIYCSSYGTYFKLGVTDLVELPKYIKAAKLLGTNIIRLFCGEKKAEDYSKEEREKFFSECKKAAKLAEENDVVFCMECHNHSFTESIEGALELMEIVNSPNFRMYWQLNQFATEEKNIEYAGKISQYVKNIHVFNWVKDKKYSIKSAEEIWTKYLECFDKERTLLLEFMPDDRLESLEKEAQALLDIAERMK